MYPLGTYRPEGKLRTASGWNGGRVRRFFTVSAVQKSSGCGKRTKKDVPFGVQNNIYPLGIYRPQAMMRTASGQSGGRGRRFFTVSAIQISSACGKRTKKDVPFGIQNNICLVGTYRPQSGVAAGDAGSSP
jgi:hypothetical protein